MGRLGSSPLTRGKRRRLQVASLVPGLIPAHAGKTWSCRPTGARRGAHPRSRGENASLPLSRKVSGGSSPLTRGKRSCTVVAGGQPGLIPAHAGKTKNAEILTLHTRAHPRSRGENAGGISGVLKSAGSSPLTRGKRRKDRLRLARLGLIPAHAGKTPCCTSPQHAAWAHPRSRGENSIWPGGITKAAGSSPLTRGKRIGRRRIRR